MESFTVPSSLEPTACFSSPYSRHFQNWRPRINVCWGFPKSCSWEKSARKLLLFLFIHLSWNAAQNVIWHDRMQDLQRIIHSPNKRPAKCLTGRSHLASHSPDVVNPAATAKAINTDLFLFLVPMHGKRHSSDWKESETGDAWKHRHQPRAQALLEHSYTCRTVLAVLFCLPCQGAGGPFFFSAKVMWNPCLSCSKGI